MQHAPQDRNESFVVAVVSELIGVIAGGLVTSATGNTWWLLIGVMSGAVLIVVIRLLSFRSSSQQTLFSFEIASKKLGLSKLEKIALAVLALALIFSSIPVAGVALSHLRRNCSLSGKLHHAANIPVSGIIVFAFELGSLTPVGHATRTDDSGFFSFQNLRKRQHVILALSQANGTCLKAEYIRLATPSGNQSEELPFPAVNEKAMPSTKVFFETDKYLIDPSSRRDVYAGIGAVARGFKGLCICEGNTDERGTDEYNFELGMKRANAARGEVRNLGLDKVTIVCVSWGKANPANRSGDAQALAENRRVEITFVSSFNSNQQR